MTTAQIIFITLMLLPIYLFIFQGLRHAKSALQILGMFAFVGTFILTIIVVLNLIYINKKAQLPKPDRYYEVVIPQDTLYRKIQ